MDTLFPVEPALPKGFVYIPDFINEDEEISLYHEILKLEFHTFHFQGYQAKRKVASFGYDWSFETRSLLKGKDIPEVFHSLIEKVATHISIESGQIAELLVTEYPVGSVINWHRDAPPFDIIAGISFLTDCTFRFRPYNKAEQNRKSIVSLPIKRGSLYVMKGESRSDWEHSISPVKDLRYSITLRTLRV
jgi:alkylated DNA repair dioxygenase AlkB